MPDVFRKSPDPDTAPRELTPDVVREADVHGRFLREFGSIWMRVGGLVSLALAALALWLHPAFFAGAALAGTIALTGVLLSFLGARQRRAALDIYRDGAEAEGEVVDVRLQRRTKLNGKSPWRVKYEYRVGNRVMEGVATFWGVEPRVSAGDPVVVVHRREAPSESVLWTKVEPVEAKRVESPAANVRIAVEARETEAAAGDQEAEDEAIEGGSTGYRRAR